GEKRSREELKSSEPSRKRPCYQKEHGAESTKDKKKRERSCDSENRPEKKCKVSDLKEEGPKPESSAQGNPPSAPSTPKVTFSLIGIIGKGAFGKVYKVIDNNKNTLAVKIVQRGESQAADRNLQRENRMLKMAAGSPFVIHSRSELCFSTKNSWYFVMEYASGGDLGSHIKKFGPLPFSSATFYAAETTSGLQFLHAKGIIHRDIKPDNLLIDNGGHIKIADFGLALDKTEGISEYGGTRGYIAPEIIACQPYNLAADYFSLGVVIFKMITARHCSECYPSALASFGLNRSTVDIIEKLICHNPRKRLGTNGCIRSHPFFKAIDWSQLERLEIPPPFIPGE
ncbi:regulation of T-helper 2 cell activation, partial [Pristimantis euphronides]